jgi:cytochrome c peroxidase
MRKAVVLIAVMSFIMIQVSNLSCGEKKFRNGQDAVQQWFKLQTDSLLMDLDSMDTVVNGGGSLVALQAKYAATRFRYKKVESLVEYYFQGLNRRINGPALPDVKTDDNQVWPPHGFQVIEQFLYSPFSDDQRVAISNEIHLLQTDIRFVKANISSQAILPRHVQELTQHEMIRIGVLGITGFDAPLSKLSLQESVYALSGIEDILQAYTLSEPNANKLNDQQVKLFANASGFIRSNPDFDSFDRMRFLNQYLSPLSHSLREVPFKADAADSVFTKPFGGTLKDLLQGKGFNPDYYASYSQSATNPDKAELGRMLFSDKSLSANNTISCATCHQPDRYFTDGMAKAGNFVHGGTLARNTPSLYYAALQSNQFYDLRSVSLEDQIHEVMNNKEEFNLNSSEVSQRLNANAVYAAIAEKAFGKKEISGFEVRNAVAAYIRSLMPFNSRFDAYMRGDTTAINASEIKGFNLFAGKAKCATCHFIPLFNGNIPPWFTKSESEIIGVPISVQWSNAIIDSDSGRYKMNRLPEFMFAFKTPTVRNAAESSPYMHNGVYKDLEQVVEFYHKGGGVGLGIDLPFQSLPFDSLSLDPSEKGALIAFMQTLTDQVEKRK